jgi:hypothetical protein
MFDPYASLRGDAYRSAPRGYYVVKQLLIWGGTFGVLVGLYRNDVIRDLARKVGQEQRYLAAEQGLVGSPGWGTPRSMESVLGGGPAPVAVPEPAPASTASPASAEPAAPAAEPAAPTSKPVAAAPAPPAAAAAPASTALVPVSVNALGPAEPLKPVSLDSLPLAGAAPSRAAAEPARTPVASAPASRPAVAPAPAKASKLALDDAPAPKVAKAPPKPAEPERPKATQARASDNPLLGAIRGAVRARPASDAIPK